MNFTKAFAVFMQIDSKEFTKDEKYEAIQQVLDAATINSITKRQGIADFHKFPCLFHFSQSDIPIILLFVTHPDAVYFVILRASRLSSGFLRGSPMCNTVQLSMLPVFSQVPPHCTANPLLFPVYGL